MNLCDELTIRMLLERHGFHFSKSMGQNFLIDPQIPADIAAASQADETCGVLEIGPGIGPLTSELAQRAGKVVSIELDRALLPILTETMAPYSNVEIVPGDVTRLDLKALIGEKFAGLRPIVCANLPYNITTPILELLWDGGLPIRQISVMVQKEVADKLLAAPSTPAYSLTSVRCQYRTIPQLVQVVPAECFTPPPKVDSAFVRMDMRAQPPAPVADEALLWRMVKAGFGMRRKTLINALKGVVEGEAVRAALSALGLQETVRGEALAVETWIALANACARE